MKNISVPVRMAVAAQDNTWVEEAHHIAQHLWNNLSQEERQDGKHGQLRNIQEVAEESSSWAALALFIRYQAARNQVPRRWAEDTVERLDKLQVHAKNLASQFRGADEKAIHMEIVSRVLGFAVRWHIWDVHTRGKKKEEVSR